MSLENRWYRLVASQLAHPRGVLGKVTANRLNEGNRPMVASAIEAALVVAIADPAAMEAMPFVEHGFRVRPVAELLRLMQAAGFVSARDRQLQLGGPLRQLLIASRPD
ncbi:hypothetical protein HJ590_15370 [Naumannella sp. ID2617S]|nr:hypothetical protein [Naumannella sp. ID2617S]